MPWTSRGYAKKSSFGRNGLAGTGGFSIGAMVLILTVALARLLSGAPPEKRLSVYSTAANYSLPILQRGGQDYVGLLELLDPLGKVSAKTDGPRWRIHYNNVLGDFAAGKTRARVQGRDADLPARFLLENGRGLVPVASLASLLPRFLGGPATLQEQSLRLFIGNIATHFTVALAGDNPPRLIFHFTSPVNPSVASEPGKVRLTFNREPVVAPASPMLTFGSKAIPSATYSEGNGAAEITVDTTIPLAASFAPDGRTVTLAPPNAPPQSAAQANPPAAATSSSTPASAANAPPATAPVLGVTRRYFAVVDASHGGYDRGETLSYTLVEKDITVSFARRLRQELQNRGISTLVLRDSDANLSLDERASFANTVHAAVYIALHAASNGHGVRLYTVLLPYGGDDRGSFRSWTTAQSAFLPLSQTTVASVATELQKQQVPVRTLIAPLRPLNNVTTSAIAVEVAPSGSDVNQLMLPEYQQLIASAVANGIAAVRDKLGAAP